MLIKEFIIHCVHKFPCIWDMSHDDYKNSQKKDGAFKKISQFINNAHGSLEISGRIYK